MIVRVLKCRFLLCVPFWNQCIIWTVWLDKKYSIYFTYFPKLSDESGIDKYEIILHTAENKLLRFCLILYSQHDKRLRSTSNVRFIRYQKWKQSSYILKLFFEYNNVSTLIHYVCRIFGSVRKWWKLYKKMLSLSLWVRKNYCATWSCLLLSEIKEVENRKTRITVPVSDVITCITFHVLIIKTYIYMISDLQEYPS